MIREATVKLIQKIDLTMEETMAVINEIMSAKRRRSRRQPS